MTWNSQFRDGQQVHVEFDGTVQGDTVPGTSIYVRRDDGMLNVINPLTCTVTPADPEGWPVQLGDVWEQAGVLWFVRGTEYGLQLISADSNDGRMRPEELKEGPPVPVLKWRNK
jgi:hypothetical protein